MCRPFVKVAFNLAVTFLWHQRSGTCLMWSFVVFQKWDTAVIKETGLTVCIVISSGKHLKLR